MDKNVAAVIGAVGALALADPSHAAVSAPVEPDNVMRVNSYADLLKPIPNAVALRQALAEARAAEAATAEPEMMTVQYYHHHHHHHHHHHYYRRRYHHHHHHHHHGIGFIVR